MELGIATHRGNLKPGNYVWKIEHENGAIIVDAWRYVETIKGKRTWDYDLIIMQKGGIKKAEYSHHSHPDYYETREEAILIVHQRLKKQLDDETKKLTNTQEQFAKYERIARTYLNRRDVVSC